MVQVNKVSKRIEIHIVEKVRNQLFRGKSCPIRIKTTQDEASTKCRSMSHYYLESELDILFLAALNGVIDICSGRMTTFLYLCNTISLQVDGFIFHTFNNKYQDEGKHTIYIWNYVEPV